MAVAEVTVVPIGTASPSISKYVAECHKVLEQAEGIKYQLTPMGTIIEGDVDDILAVVRKMHEVPFDRGAQRVSTTLKIDERRDKELTMSGKVESVEQKLRK
ncbi:MAG: MTH1187 family thiamine-binding protein [Thermoanaerobacteraceae bacterium]|nr:MTH1187 family thiamine-binding protein [Thermoanaerobacteraceae bacterium]